MNEPKDKPLRYIVVNAADADEAFELQLKLEDEEDCDYHVCFREDVPPGTIYTMDTALGPLPTLSPRTGTTSTAERSSPKTSALTFLERQRGPG